MEDNRAETVLRRIEARLERVEQMVRGLCGQFGVSALPSEAEMDAARKVSEMWKEKRDRALEEKRKQELGETAEEADFREFMEA